MPFACFTGSSPFASGDDPVVASADGDVPVPEKRSAARQASGARRSVHAYENNTNKRKQKAWSVK